MGMENEQIQNHGKEKASDFHWREGGGGGGGSLEVIQM